MTDKKKRGMKYHPDKLDEYRPRKGRQRLLRGLSFWADQPDEKDRLIRKTSPNGIIDYDYDDNGNLTHVYSNHNDGVNTYYQYDALNRPVTVTDARSTGQIATPTPTETPTATDTPTPTPEYPFTPTETPTGTIIFTNTFTPSATPTVYIDGHKTIYTYNAIGNLSKITLPNGVAVTYTYDQLNRATTVMAHSGATTLSRYVYDLGPAGNRRSVAELNTRSVTWTYDDLYRLTSEQIITDPAGNTGTVSYTYDNVGNRQTRTSTVPGISNQNFTGQYDSNDRYTVGAEYTYNDNGDTLTDPSGKTYTYDALGRLLTVSGTGLSESFTYDGDGNKVSQTVNGVTTNYLVDTNNLTGYSQVVEEIQNGGISVVYTYGTSRISQDRQLSSNNWQKSFYGYDLQGSVRYLMDVFGNITDTYDYDAFGTLTHETHAGTPTANVYLFDGEQLDANTGFYYLRARYMNPGIGRFQTMDEFEGTNEIPFSLHKYFFAANDPICNYDPSGKTTKYGTRVTDFFRDVVELPTRGARIIFNGQRVLWVVNSPLAVGDPIILYSFPANSGLNENGENYQFPKYQTGLIDGKKDPKTGYFYPGPVPEGKYSIFLVYFGLADDKDQDDFLDPHSGITKIPKAWEKEWGKFRAKLDSPNEFKPKMYERGGFYIHDSEKGFTHGCIETKTELFSLLFTYMKKSKDKTISVSVNYSGVDSTFGGRGGR